MASDVINDKYRNARRADIQSKGASKEVSKLMSDDIERMLRLFRRMPNAEERWDYMCDNTPDSTIGATMCDIIIQRCTNAGIELKKFTAPRSKLKYDDIAKPVIATQIDEQAEIRKKAEMHKRLDEFKHELEKQEVHVDVDDNMPF